MSVPAMLWRSLPLLICLCGVYVAVAQHALIPLQVLHFLPYVLGVVLLSLALVFNRLRFLVPVLVILASYGFIRYRLQVSLADEATWRTFFALNVFYCLFLLLGACWPEKGLRHPWSVVLLISFAVSALVIWKGWGVSFLVASLAGLGLMEGALVESHYWFSQGLVLLHGLTIAVLVAFAVWRRSVADHALALTAVMGAFVFFEYALPNVSAVVFSAVLLSLFVVYQQSSYRVTYTDALTGIPGRRSLEEYLPTLGRRYAIAMLDVDHFKKFNDTHGHDVGDQVLKMVAARVAAVKGGGKAFRYGGEEFTVVFNRHSSAECKVYLEAIREAIANYQLVLRAEDRLPDAETGKKQRGRKRNAQARALSVTISIGVADSAPGASPQDIIRQADERLYEAKKRGRNQTVAPS